MTAKKNTFPFDKLLIGGIIVIVLGIVAIQFLSSTGGISPYSCIETTPSFASTYGWTEPTFSWERLECNRSSSLNPTGGKYAGSANGDEIWKWNGMGESILFKYDYETMGGYGTNTLIIESQNPTQHALLAKAADDICDYFEQQVVYASQQAVCDARPEQPNRITIVNNHHPGGGIEFSII